jgi:hypothetical protein
MILADKLQIKWFSSGGRMNYYFGWYSARGEETVMVFDGCVKNPGPEGMLELCTWDNDGYGWFIFEGDTDWHCLRKTFENGGDPGEEIWDEVSCDW